MAEASDLVLFVGPVEVRNLRTIQFEHPTDIIMIRGGNTSDEFRAMARQGLDNIVTKKTGKSLREFRKVAISAYSKGGSFTDEVLRVPAIMDRIDAVILNDAVFGSQHEALREFFTLAASGERLMVITSTNNQASVNLPKRARESVLELIGPDVGSLRQVAPGVSMPVPSGGVWNEGEFYWYDYVKPNGVNDIEHGAHHDLAEDTWEAHLVPFFGGGSRLMQFFQKTTVIGAAIRMGKNK